MRFSLENAGYYASANYWVFLPDGTISFKPWCADKSLAKLHKQHGVKTSALISASNPLSEIVSETANRKANNALQKECTNLPIYKAEGSRISSKKKAEKSFLILGLSREESLSLGRKYKQHAIIFNCNRNGQVVPMCLLLLGQINICSAKSDLN